jgi:predicted site-specific integrase-resolvase
MTTTEPIVSDSGRYPTMEACEILKISYKTLIKYTDQGAIKCGIRKSNKRKFYTGSEIKKFWKASY